MRNEGYNESRNVEYDDIMSGAYADSRDSRIEGIANSSEVTPTGRRSNEGMCRREKVGLGVMIGAVVLGLGIGAYKLHQVMPTKLVPTMKVYEGLGEKIQEETIDSLTGNH